MKNLIKILSSIYLIQSLVACVSMSTTQTARTVAPGKSMQTFGGGAYKSGSVVESDDAADTDVDDVSVPYFEYSYRQGITEKWDGGLKLTLSGSTIVDGKYSLYQGESFAAAVGAGLGYMSLESKVGDTKTKNTILDLSIPLYLSYDFATHFSVYTAPKYIQRSVSGDSSGSTSMTGATVGVKIGHDWGTFIEVSQFKASKAKDPITQSNLSLFWNSNSWF